MKKQKIRWFVLLSWLAVLSLLASCSAPVVEASAPTPNVQAIRTEAAGTAVAEVLAKDVPPTETPTLVPPTVTITVTASLEPSATASITPTFTNTPTSTEYAGKGVPTLAPDYPVLLYRSPNEYQYFAPNDIFDVHYILLNGGKKTWTTDYYMMYKSGEDMHYNGTHFMLKNKVAPGERAEFLIDFRAPKTSGTHTTNWVLINDNADIIMELQLNIIVQ